MPSRSVNSLPGGPPSASLKGMTTHAYTQLWWAA